MEDDGLGLHLAVLHVHLVAAEDDGDVLAHPGGGPGRTTRGWKERQCVRRRREGEESRRGRSFDGTEENGRRQGVKR